MPDAARVGPNAIDPDRLTPEERVVEVGRILAAGVLRLHAGRGEAPTAKLQSNNLRTRLKQKAETFNWTSRPRRAV